MKLKIMKLFLLTIALSLLLVGCMEETIQRASDQDTENGEPASENPSFPDDFPNHIPYPDDYIELRSAVVEHDYIELRDGSVEDDSVGATYYAVSLRLAGDMDKLEELTDLYISFFEDNNYEHSMGQVGLGTFNNFIYVRDGERVDVSITYRENQEDVLLDLGISIEE